jgi:hypothetical protein
LRPGRDGAGRRLDDPDGGPKPGRPRPVWSSLGLALVVTAGTSAQIADKHHPDAGARLLDYGSGVLLGMAILTFLVVLRQRLGRDSPE